MDFFFPIFLFISRRRGAEEMKINPHIFDQYASL
jgi:hypothetical protein